MANTPLQNLQATYANICAQLAEITANPKPTYSTDGRSVSWGEHFNNLAAQLEKLGKIPDVAPDQSPMFTAVSVAR
ncbi:unnamed protein product [Gemmata massiliana]|uniref:Uncharacterized protein n=1 Tax=Gemmata massiliana TaxID=1210884 RepID=A0A6P2D1C3_9BACT|nr:hypothetical protein [Gemmata massiliana]VTR93212.1 unnamed protein product [Gemmata massiliana]